MGKQTGLKKPYSATREQISADAILNSYATSRFLFASVEGVEADNLFLLTSDANVGQFINIQVKPNEYCFNYKAKHI